MVATIALFLLIFLLLPILWYLQVKKYHDVAKLPGPGVFQIISNMFDNNKSAQGVFNTLVSLNKQYGTVVKLWLNPFKPMLVVADVKYVEFFLTSNLHLDKSDFYRFLVPYIGEGLATAAGDLWKVHRKLLNPAFHLKIMEDYVQVFDKYWTQLIQELVPKANEKSLDIYPILNNYTLSIISESFLEQAQPDLHDEYMAARTSFYSIIIERTLSFIKRNEFLYRFTKTCKKQQECVKSMNKYSTKAIEDFIARGRENNGYYKQQGYLDILLGPSFAKDEVRGHVNTLIIAGHDTTASMLSFTLFELSKHQDVQKKIVQETDLILGLDKSAPITFHDIHQMKYVECVLKEVLRLYAPVPFFDRKTKEDIVIDGIRIPKGTDVTICCYNLHRNAEYFSDPENFDPDRFAPENIEKIPAFAYVPFSSGPRSCIGKNFAMLEMKSAIAKIIRNFEILPTAHELQLSTEFVLKSDNGMRLRLRKR